MADKANGVHVDREIGGRPVHLQTSASPVSITDRIRREGETNDWLSVFNDWAYLRSRELIAAQTEPPPCLLTPDWALANAFRKAVMDGVAPNAWAAEVVAAADRAAEEHRRATPDYATDPKALAHWMRVHYRAHWDEPQTRIPEIVWICEALNRAASDYEHLQAKLEAAEQQLIVEKENYRRLYATYRDDEARLNARREAAEQRVRELRAPTFPMMDGPNIPDWLARVIFAGYHALYPRQSFDTIRERGGFGWDEVPTMYREKVARNAMEAALQGTGSGSADNG